MKTRRAFMKQSLVSSLYVGVAGCHATGGEGGGDAGGGVGDASAPPIVDGGPAIDGGAAIDGGGAGAPWRPPYPTPVEAGSVVAIGGDAAFGSVYPTNVAADVRPAEIGGAGSGNQMITGGDSSMQYIASYSKGGAVVSAGSGGHHGTVNFGAMLFDLEDARWKRVWTGGTTTENVDIRSGTKIHGCLNYEDDLHSRYDSGGLGSWHPDDWTPTSRQLEVMPRTADPRDQTWEITRAEPYPWSPTVVPPDASGSVSSPITSGPKGWPYPGEWAGLQGQLRSGYVGVSARFPETVPGMPAPSHCWDLYFEVTPENGGGPKGSIASCRHTYMGHNSDVALNVSHRFDLDAGTWHQFSENSSSIGGDAPAGGDPWWLPGAVAACLDPVTQRMFMIAQHSSRVTRVNYMNLSDRTWRNMSVGAGTPTAGRTEALSCDPDRRLLIMCCSEGPVVRAFDLSTVGPEPLPTGGTGGWRALPITAAPGFSIDRSINPGYGQYNYPWVYYPPNGKLYRFVPVVYPRPESSEAWDELGDFTFDTIQRLTPPPIVDSPPADYYFTQPWTYDEITLSAPMARGSYGSIYSSVGAKRYYYVPVLECFVFLPCDHGNRDTPTRNPCYLVKPF